MTKKSDKEYTWVILSTPDDIGFREFREMHDKFWLTKDREILRISNMETSHINHCIDMLTRAGQRDTLAFNGLTKEIARRETLAALEKIERAKKNEIKI